MTAPWLKFRNAEPAAEALAPALDAGPWQKFQAPVVAAGRAVADVSMPSDAINTGLKSVLGETAGNIAGYIPGIAALNTWMDAAQREKLNPDTRSATTQMRDGFENVMRGAGQGTNPTAQPEQKVLGEAFEDAGGAWMLGDGSVLNPAEHVILKDPSSGKLMAYSRSKQSDEMGITGASRVITQGLLTGPVTGVARGTALVSPATRAMAGERAAQGAADLQAFDRSNVPVFSPAFSGAPTRMMAKGLSDTWGVGAPLQDALGNTYRGMAAEAGRIADDISPVSTFDQAGATVQRGLERFRADGVRDIEPGVLAERGIQPNAPVQPHQMMSVPARQRAADAAPIRAENQGGAAQTARGVNVPAARSLDQTYTARRGAEDMSDAEVQQLIAAPANDTSFAVRSEALYENAQRQLPPQMRTNNTRNPQQFAAMNSRNAVNALRAEQEGSQIPGGIFGRYQGMADRVQTNLQIEDLRAMRTAVGRDIALLDFGRTGLDTQQLKTLYGSISRDMEIYYQDVANRAHLATRIGNNNPAHVGVDVARRADRALYEFRRADRYFRQGMQRIETFMTVMGANRPELAAQKIVQAAGEGGQGNLGMVRNALSALRPEERQAVSSLVVRQMGQPTASTRGLPQETGFSPQSFVTRYNKLDARARELLFPGEHGRALDDLFRVADRVANVETFANTSNTARTAMNAGGVLAVGGLAGGWPAALGGAASGFTASVLLSRPAYARWATQYLRLKSQAARAPAGIDAALATQVNRLAQMAQHDPQLTPLLQHLRNSSAGEVGVGEGANEQRQQEKERPAPGKGQGNQGSNDGAAPNHVPINSDGSVLKEGPKPTFRDKAADFLGSIHGGDATHKNTNYTAIDALSMFPPIGAVVGIDEARHMSEEGSPVAAAGLGILSLLPGGGGAKKGAEKALGAVAREIEDLAPRYRQLFGKDFVAPKARPGTPADEVLKGEMQTLEELRTVVTSKEAALAKMPDVPSTPKIRDVTGERDEMLRGIEENPTTRAIPGRQGIPSIKEQKGLIQDFYKEGNKLPERPWGSGPLDYQRVVRDQHEAKQALAVSKQQIADGNKALRAAEKSNDKKEIARLKAELKAANATAVDQSNAIAKLNAVIKKALGGED